MTLTSTLPQNKIQRIIGHIKGNAVGPTIVFFAGVHGNEPAGVKALEQVFHELKNQKKTLFGECYGLVGNINALEANLRFIEEDLNRIWSFERMNRSTFSNTNQSLEELEMLDLYQLIIEILEKGTPPFYFIDLHTTSGETTPFIVMNDSLLNRKFTQHFPLPIVLGIEEYLSGALLSFINELGYVSIGFESGQHHDENAVKHAKLFIEYTMALIGFNVVGNSKLKLLKSTLGNATATDQRFYEIYYQHLIKENARFKMMPGFENFQTVSKGVTLALNGDGIITTKKRRQLFMPLYQSKGYEGFYFIRSIPYLFLKMSEYCRLLKMDRVLVLLPGVSWASTKKGSLVVNKKVARFFAKSIFHLLGYRTREVNDDKLLLKSREQNSKNSEYQGEPWYKKPRTN